MASDAASTTSRSRLLALPAELQVKVIAKLGFPDVHRLSVTCKNFRNMIRQDFYSQALFDLETDWVGALACAAGERGSRLNMRRSLRNTGYSDEDIDRIGDFAPCYTCMRLAPPADFDKKDPTYRIHELADLRRHSPNIRPSSPEMKRRCITCSMEDGRPNKDYPWIKSTDFRFVYCRKCKSVEKTDAWVSCLQNHCQLCDDCVADVQEGWDDYRDDLRERIEDAEADRDVLQERLEAAEDNLNQLEEYADWMDRGAGLDEHYDWDCVDEEPPLPEETDRLDWNSIDREADDSAVAKRERSMPGSLSAPSSRYPYCDRRKPLKSAVEVVEQHLKV